MTKTVVTWLLVLALGAAVIFGIVKSYEAWRDGVFEDGREKGAGEVREQWNTDKIARAADLQDAVAAARKEEQEIAATAAEGEKNARAQAEATAAKNADAARRSTALAGGLSSHLADLDNAARAAGTPDVASCPAAFAQQRDAAVKARALFGSCVAEYRSLGQDADDALAGIELRLATAVAWIRSTRAPGAEEVMVLP